MKRATITNLAALVIVGAVSLPLQGWAQSIGDYQSTPPFVADVVPPNVLLILDNSGSMGGRACDPAWCGVHADGSLTPVVESFVSTTTYTGFFQTTGCYTYDTGNTRFDLASTRATVNGVCSSTQWDGNFLNWATFRRFDALKKSMSGGDCAVTRNANGTCPATGSPAKITIKA